MPESIDLRSDTVTQPSPEMRQAIARAEVGDAVIDIDPTVEELEKRTAEILGKEEDVFMPSGSMTNQVAIRIHCDRGTEFLCEADAHVYHYEQAAFAQLSGVAVQTLAGENGVLQLEQVQRAVRPENDHMVRTRLVCLENTHNRWGGRIQPQDQMVEICQWAKENDLRRHLDGARLWNAAVATNKSERELAQPFDSVSVCFSKGLGAPVGSALAGSPEFIYEARRAKKLFGGSMRQCGILAAAALYALDHHRDELVHDHRAAEKLADTCRQCAALSIRGDRVDTNMVICEVDPQWGTAQNLVDALAQNEIHCFAIDPQAIRLVTHRDVSSSQIETVCDVIQQVTAHSRAAS